MERYRKRWSETVRRELREMRREIDGERDIQRETWEEMERQGWGEMKRHNDTLRDREEDRKRMERESRDERWGERWSNGANWLETGVKSSSSNGGGALTGRGFKTQKADWELSKVYHGAQGHRQRPGNTTHF